MEDFGDDEVFQFCFSKRLLQYGDILLKPKLSVPEHDLRERGPGVDPGDSTCRAGL